MLRRAGGDAGKTYVPTAWSAAGKAEPMFVVKTGEPPHGAAVVTVEYDGATYYVPRDASAGRSMQALSLLAQLIGLHKNAAELPTTTSVRVINP